LCINPTLLAEPIISISVPRPLLLVTEGVLDIACLKQFSRLARQGNPALPDLHSLTEAERIVWLPTGGGDLAAWIDRLAPLRCPEFHLYDREQEPESGLRQRIVDQINARPNCRAALTGKGALANDLHPAAIQAVFGIDIEITNDAAVAELVATAHADWNAAWPDLPYRARQRQIFRIKRRLNTEVAGSMTAKQLAERDPAGEVRNWFRQIADLLRTTTRLEITDPSP
jgi:hypothetical protein